MCVGVRLTSRGTIASSTPTTPTPTNQQSQCFSVSMVCGVWHVSLCVVVSPSALASAWLFNFDGSITLASTGSGSGSICLDAAIKYWSPFGANQVIVIDCGDTPNENRVWIWRSDSLIENTGNPG